MRFFVGGEDCLAVSSAAQRHPPRYNPYLWAAPEVIEGESGHEVVSREAATLPRLSVTNVSSLALTGNAIHLHSFYIFFQCDVILASNSV